MSAKQKSPLIGKVPMQEYFPPKLLLSADALYVVLHIPQVLFQFLFSCVSDPHITMPILHPNRRKALTLFPAKWQHRLNPQNKCSRTEATAKGKKRIRKTWPFQLHPSSTVMDAGQLCPITFLVRANYDFSPSPVSPFISFRNSFLDASWFYFGKLALTMASKNSIW